MQKVEELVKNHNQTYLAGIAGEKNRLIHDKYEKYTDPQIMMAMNMDMSKFTSIKDYPEYRAFFAPLFDKLGPVGLFLDSFVKMCFLKKYEIRDEIFVDCAPRSKDCIKHYHDQAARLEAEGDGPAEDSRVAQIYKGDHQMILDLGDLSINMSRNELDERKRGRMLAAIEEKEVFGSLSRFNDIGAIKGRFVYVPDQHPQGFLGPLTSFA